MFTFSEVKNVPKKMATGKSKGQHLQVLMEEFMTEGIKIAKVNIPEGHYSSMMVRYGTIKAGAKKSENPIKVMKRGDEIYLVRTDM